MFSPRTSAALIGMLAVSLTLAGCSGTDSGSMGGMSGMDDSSSSSSPSPSASSSSTAVFNDQDVMFLQGMIPHHTQAVEMSEMILGKTDVDPRVTELAQTIKDAQEPEIDLMSGWLEEWGKSSSMSINHEMDGMMSDEDMASLKSATGVDASRLFLEQMTVHHSSAIQMAQMEMESGENPDSIDLAQTIVDSQQAEIEQMQEILSTL